VRITWMLPGVVAVILTAQTRTTKNPKCAESPHKTVTLDHNLV